MGSYPRKSFPEFCSRLRRARSITRPRQLFQSHQPSASVHTAVIDRPAHLNRRLQLPAHSRPFGLPKNHAAQLFVQLHARHARWFAIGHAGDGRGDGGGGAASGAAEAAGQSHPVNGIRLSVATGPTFAGVASGVRPARRLPGRSPRNSRPARRPRWRCRCLGPAPGGQMTFGGRWTSSTPGYRRGCCGGPPRSSARP